MATTIAVLASLGFIGWIIYRAVRRKTIRAHTIVYAISIITGIFTYAFFLGMDIPQLLKIMLSIIVGVLLIFTAAYFERRRQLRKQ